MAEKPWLARYTFDAEDGDRNYWLNRVHDVAGWSVASTRWGILAYSDGGRQHYPCGHEDGHTRAAAKAITPYLNYPLVPQFSCSLHSLAQWCEFVAWEWCDACHGKQSELCPECDGRGRFVPRFDPRLGFLGGVCIDRNRLAFLLAPELFRDDPGVQVSHGALAKSDTRPQILFLDGCRFRLVMMALSDVRPHFPRFHPDPLYGELWQARDDPVTRLALIDWLLERDDPYARILQEV